MLYYKSVRYYGNPVPQYSIGRRMPFTLHLELDIPLDKVRDELEIKNSLVSYYLSFPEK